MREKWLAGMARKHNWKAGAELGIWYGRTFFHLLDNVPELTMIGVDIWIPTKFGHHENQAENRRGVLARVDEYGGRAIVYEEPTLEAVNRIPDKSLDFVFVDAAHDYQSVWDDIAAWAPKVKDGGYMTGHDIDMKDVAKAVYGIFPYASAPDNSDCCWYARV